ncbi:MAG: alpha/beta hydrolase [Acidobacteria bacterium]|nr:alpha/beta hydrolase [Acidobacteriota bacterium]
MSGQVGRAGAGDSTLSSMAPRELPWDTDVRLVGRDEARVLLLGGFGAGLENLRPLAGRLHAGGLTVHAATLGGHTGDQALFERSRTWHFYAHARHIRQRLEEDFDGPIVLGGYSTGALVALLLAAWQPARVAGLVLISPVLRTARRSTQLVGYSVGSLYYLGLPLAAAAATLGLAVTLRRQGWRRRGLLLRTLGTAAVLATATAGLRSITVPLRTGGPMVVDGEEVVPPHFTRASLLTGSTLVPLQLAARRQLPALAMPTCLVFGGADDVVDVGYGVRLARRLPSAEVHVVAGAPHRVVTTPECLDVVGRFVRQALRDLPATPPARP